MTTEDWIKVEDKLPEPDEDVIVYDDRCGVIIASYNPYCGWVSYEHGVLDHVTHWGPLALPRLID